MICVMRRWKNGDTSNIGVFASLYWAERSIRSTFGKQLWIEDEKKPATLTVPTPERDWLLNGDVASRQESGNG